MCTHKIRFALLPVYKNGLATAEVTTTTTYSMTMKARVTFDVELPERYTVDTPHEEIREFLGRMYSELKTISNVEIISPEPPAEPEEPTAEPEEPTAEPEEPPTEYSGWDVFYMHMTDLDRSNIWKSVGPDPRDVMRIIDGELDKFKEFKGLEYPVRADFLNDETNRTDFGLMIDTINQKLTEYSRIPKPHEPGVRRLDDELLAILIDAVNTIADEFRARPGMKPPNAVDILRYFLDARRRAAEDEPAAEPKPAEAELEKYVRRCVQRIDGAEGYDGLLFINDEPYCAWSDVIGHMESKDDAWTGVLKGHFQHMYQTVNESSEDEPAAEPEDGA
eukprot:SAG11_NODE_5041_length_1675_cov_214.680784_2_plen_334_part_00